MATVENTELVERFDQFFRNYYRDAVGKLARRYPNEQRSLTVDWADLYRFDQDLADDYLAQPDQLQEYAEEALRLHDLPVDVSLGQAHVRIQNLDSVTDIRAIRARDVNKLVSVQGIIRKSTDVRPKVQEAAFECQRCGTLTYIPQSGAFQEPHECQGCERQGPFTINYDQSTFVDAQKLRVQESPEGLRGGETPQSIDVHIEDDLTGRVAPGDHVTVTGALRIEQQTNQNQKSRMFDVHMEGHSVVIDDEEFEDMDITDEDKREIIELSQRGEALYGRFVDSVAPSIYGFDDEKLAMTLQLFAGVTKSLPDGTRIRGDLHILLIGDPGTGKSQLLQYIRNIAPRSVYTSGKGSSSAGLCVAGNTFIHTSDGFKTAADISVPQHPLPVNTDTSAELSRGVYTFDRDTGRTRIQETDKVWRMPEKPCHRIGTAHGKELVASVNTPVLTCGEQGLEWKPIAEVEAGEHVAVPRYSEVERSDPPIEDYLELTNEKVKLDDDSLQYLRERLDAVFGGLRSAAAELDLSESFIYTSLWERYVPIDKLNRILSAIGATRSDVRIERAMLRHGESVRLPDRFGEDLMYLIGLVFGDGDISVSRRGDHRGLVRISNGDEAILERAVEIIDRVFDKQVEIERQADRVPCIRLNSHTIARFLYNVGMRSPKAELALDDALTTAEHTDAFLRGFMDADGSVSARTEGGSSVLTSTISERFARQLQLVLETYGIRARRRERDRRGTYQLDSGHTIESKHIQHFVELYGVDIERYAEAIGFESEAKAEALAGITGDARRREETIPVANALATADGPSGRYWANFNRGDNPGRGGAMDILDDRDHGPVGPLVEEAVDADLRWDEVVTSTDAGQREVFDLTVPETHNFFGNGIVTHNTAAAVKDDFGDGQQWSLEAGALVLADMGIAAVDELDKMRPEDRSAMHQALEQQEISISKAGINATLKARCALLGAANPKYGRFDQYEPIAEQIDLEPALISRFDLIFTVTDAPDEERDAELADHILRTNYAGELRTQMDELASPTVSDADVDDASDTVMPAIEPELFRKYVAYAKRNVFPSMTDEARQAIRDFYVDLRARGTEEDSPVPITARKLEALVRLAEASARVRLSDTVEVEDAERVITIVRNSLKDIGVDPETGQFDADVIETGTSKTQRDRIKSIRALIAEIETEYEEGAPVEEVISRAGEAGIDESKVEHEIEKLRQRGEVYEPATGHLRTT